MPAFLYVVATDGFGEGGLVMSSDTIFALSSGALPAGIAVIRVSGPQTVAALERLCGLVPEPRLARLATVRNIGGEELDRGLVLYFAGPASFTGEDCAEFHVHGSRAVVSALLDSLSQIGGLRHAEAGEFARRAFENGKLDLVEAEGLAELINAETEAQRRLALYMSEGQLSRRYTGWMERLSQSRALIEAELDFADEGDIPGSVAERVWTDVEVLAAEMEAALADRVAEIVRDGFRVAIAGPPNAGKSTLLNCIAKRDVAIVTDIAGTTRDVLTVDVDLGGSKVVFFDTAGLRETDDVVERVGIERARGAIRSADLVLYLSPDDQDAASDELADLSVETIRVRSKTDTFARISATTDRLNISAVTGEGIDSLLKLISQRASRSIGNGNLLTPLLSRHRNHVAASVRDLRAALDAVHAPLELRAELLRSAANELARLTGRVSADELLGMVFSQFCVGK